MTRRRIDTKENTLSTMAPSFHHQSSVKPKGGRGAHSGKWGSCEYTMVVGGLFLFIGTVWLGVRYNHFERVWNQWQQGDNKDLLPDFDDHVVEISKVGSALESGAVCLDGSPPAYYLDYGSGDGVNNWVLHLEGGGWCPTNDSCFSRAFTGLGSSHYMPQQEYLRGILSRNPEVNPDFYNWNRVKIKYCDGGSFNGDVDIAPIVEGRLRNHHGKAMNIYYRGQRVWNAVVKDLLAKGMANAKKGFLTGCSAGGLASMLHCDQYKKLMPKGSKVKCLSDGGFFLDIPDITGKRTIAEFYKQVVLLQNMGPNLPKECTESRAETECIFPTYVIPHFKTPFFMLNAAYDDWQFDNVLIPPSSDPDGDWRNCKYSLGQCSDEQMESIQGFRSDLLKQLAPLFENQNNGAFIDSCYTHCQSEMDNSWNGPGATLVDGKTIATVVGDWYFERNTTFIVDSPYPSNPSCPRS